ncbi:MAG: hypothetical protein P8M16_10440 [Acidimicrobiales bacterium]|nr:hypothetical protein [Acidimicrobiales bacterium]
MGSDAPRYGLVDREYGIRLATTSLSDDGPVWMVNLMKYREVAEYLDGRKATISGQEADDLYSPIESLTAVGAEIVFVGDVDQQLLGDNTVWDRIAVVKYPTRKSFIEMQSRPEFQESHKHKDAGMDKTIVMGCQPLNIPRASDTEFDNWSNVPYPATKSDGPVVVLHVIRFEDTDSGVQTPAYMEAYQSVAAVVASKHGLRVSGWFTVEGTIIGDGRDWHQVRFNQFPSKAAFMAVVADPTRLKAQNDHRETAIADTYTMILRPRFNRLDEPIQT